MSTPNARIIYQPLSPVVPACIESAVLLPLNFTSFPQTLTKILLYSAGSPPATGFTFSVYPSQRDAENQQNAFSAEQVAEFLSYYFIPEVPAADAVDAEAFFVVTLINRPDWLDRYGDLYGVVCLIEGMGRIPLGDPKLTPVTPYNQRTRLSIRPQWEDA